MGRRIVTALGFIVLVLLVGEDTIARDVERCEVPITFTSYDVSGDTFEELYAALRQRGPKDDTGNARYAYTRWKVAWRWKSMGDGTIDANSVDLACSASVHLPRLVNRDHHAPALLAQWDAFVERTRKHELNHIEHVRRGAPRITQMIQERAGDKGILSSKQAKAIARTVVADLHAMDRAYDMRTNHGKTEGTLAITG